MLLIALPIFLLVTTVIGGWRLGDFADSISANYSTPLRDIFVGALVAIGACLIVYRGRPVEDLALNVAGFYATFVAFVPYSLSGVLTGGTELEGQELKDAEAAADELAAALPIILGALVVIAAVFLFVEWRRGLFSRHTGAGTTTAHRVMFFLTLVLGAGFLVLLLVTVLNGTYAGVHMIAAILMIIGLATAIASHGWDPATKQSTPAIAHQYRVIVYLMGMVGLALFYELVWGLPFENAVAYIEWAAIILFTWYWVAETIRQERLIETEALTPSRLTTSP
ncbi:hypothetical protein AB0N64_12965 [Microbacterium sp. NPDC089318]